LQAPDLHYIMAKTFLGKEKDGTKHAFNFEMFIEGGGIIKFNRCAVLCLFHFMLLEVHVKNVRVCTCQHVTPLP